MRRAWTSALLLTLCALGLRLFVAMCVTNDCSGDGPVYRQIGLNVLRHGVYSVESEAPFSPTCIRVPGYPLVLAAVFALFGEGNVNAVHAVQAVVDTGTCWLAATLCVLWAPAGWDASRRRRAALRAFALAAVCPFTIVYSGTLLTETWALFWGTLCITAGVWALKAEGDGLQAWLAAGLAGGVACMFRPDLGLYPAALGALLLWEWFREVRSDSGRAGGWRAALPGTRRTLARGLAFSFAFAAVLTPWTIRNAVQFQLFQPLAPATACMPDEFVARGYARWVKTWIARPKDVEFFIWDVEEKKVDATRLPDEAFDSPEERTRVAALFERYNRGDGTGPPSAREEVDFRISPALDAEFGALATERIQRHPLRYGLLLPARRAWNIWFDTHSVYYPFDGDLLPLPNLETSSGQHILLPSFYILTWLYTVSGLAGAWLWWRSPGCRRWVFLVALLFFPRLALLSYMPNPEPRYMVELFPLVAAMGGIAVATSARASEGELTQG